MARFVHIDYPLEHGGVNRVARGLEAWGKVSIVHAALHGLAALGAPVTRTLHRWAEARRLREEDRKLWNLALSDARVMADLSRAMSQDALRDTRGYF